MRYRKSIYCMCGLLALSIFLLSGCEQGNIPLPITKSNVEGMWSYNVFTDANDVTKTYDHPYYMVLNKDGSFVVEEYVPGFSYQFDDGTWELRNDSVIVKSNNITATAAPMGTILKLKSGKMKMRFGDGYEYWGICDARRIKEAPRIVANPDMIVGHWTAIWDCHVDKEGKEQLVESEGTYTFHSDGTCEVQHEKLSKQYNWSMKPDFSFDLGEYKGKILLITVNNCIVRVSEKGNVFFRCLLRISDSSNK